MDDVLSNLQFALLNFQKESSRTFSKVPYASDVQESSLSTMLPISSGGETAEEQEEIQCSICHDPVVDNRERSLAKLKCGHEFHLECIGSAFNVKGIMECPNCRNVDNGLWLTRSSINPGPNPNRMRRQSVREIRYATDRSLRQVHSGREREVIRRRSVIPEDDDDSNYLQRRHRTRCWRLGLIQFLFEFLMSFLLFTVLWFHVSASFRG